MSVFDGLTAKDIDGNDVDLGKTYGSVPAVLVVNLASAWGLTSSNYAELVELTGKISSDKFAVLGFPCNQFGGQEPGSDAEIKKFAEGKGAKFPLFSKVDVNGANAHPLFTALKAAAPTPSDGEDIIWNFGKFLVVNGGEVKRYGPRTSPKEIAPDIQAATA
jgi:glutathione peroxidase